MYAIYFNLQFFLRHFALILLFLFIIHYTFPIICCLAKHLKIRLTLLRESALMYYEVKSIVSIFWDGEWRLSLTLHLSLQLSKCVDVTE